MFATAKKADQPCCQACRPASRSSHDRDASVAMRGAPSGLPAFMRGRAVPSAGAVRGFGHNFGIAQLLGAGPVPAPLAMSTITGATAPAHGVGFGLTLNGRTDCDYQSRFATVNATVTRATTCEDCTGDDCIHARGTLQSTFTAATTVTLPRASDFPNLTPCQVQRVQSAITNVLSPHEQQHVSAFRTYSGTVRTPFDFTGCRGDLDGVLQSMHDGIEAPRQAAAQALSDALDPFTFDVDLDC